MALVYASLVKGPHRNVAFYFLIESSLFVDAGDPRRSGFFPPYLREEVATECFEEGAVNPTFGSHTTSLEQVRVVPLPSTRVVVDEAEHRLIPDPGVVGLGDPVVLVGEVQELGFHAVALQVGPKP